MDAFFEYMITAPLLISMVIAVSIGAGIAVIGTLVVNAYFTAAQLAQNNLIGGFKFAFLSSVYAGFIGLLLYGVYQKYETAWDTAVEEVSVMTTLDRVAIALPLATRDVVRRDLRAYARSVAEEEWPLLAYPHIGSRRTADALDNLFFTYMAFEPTSERETFVFQYSVQQMHQMRVLRDDRIRHSAGSLTPLLWVVAILGTLVSFVFPWLFGSPNLVAPIVMSVLLSISTMSVLLVILKLSYPYNGEYAVPPTPFIEFARSGSR